MTTPITTEYVTQEVTDGTTMPVYVARPEGAPVKGGILVFQEIFGVNAHIRDVTERFAREGYLAAAPALFHRTDPHFESGYTSFDLPRQHAGAVTQEGLTADADAAYAWLVSQGVTGVGSTGYCLGGTVSFLANASLPLKASASYYGNIAGYGNALSFAPSLHAPQLLFWGGQDGHITRDSTRAVEEALLAAGKEYTQVTFSQAEHGFFCDARSAYNPEATRQAWAHTLAFFSTYLT